MTTERFVIELCRITGMESDGIYAKGRKNGWLEAEDEISKDRPLTRKNAARIFHMYLLKVLHVNDIDISGAKDLRDLYDCRICANHIAQAYMRGIMNARELKRDGGFLWFDLNGTDDDEEVMAQLSRFSSIADCSLI